MYSLIKDEIRKYKSIIAVVGLGYVGLPLAEAFAKKYKTIGYDINTSKVEKYQECYSESKVIFSNNPDILSEASIYIIAVPTPVGEDNVPDLSFIVGATETVGKYLSKGDIVIYESTVYPGTTEEICILILERYSQLQCRVDFKVGYSPERLSPGDIIHTIENVVKVVSGIDDDTIYCVKSLYDTIISAGTFPVSSIRVAESIKVIENTQRDINIAFMNDMAMMLDKMNIDSKEVFAGMKTKWNSLGYKPGLVGGHCIGVDPYYLISKMKEIGHNNRLLSTCREINDSVSTYISQSIIEQFDKWELDHKKSKVLIMGFTFKENCDDIRNSKVADLYQELCSQGIDTVIYDPIASPRAVSEEYGLSLIQNLTNKHFDAIILAVAHSMFLEMELDDIAKLYSNNNKLFYDVKGIFNKEKFSAFDIVYKHL